MSAERLATFHVIVHAQNLNAAYGKPLTIIAATRQEAVDRAVDLGWSGRPSDARVRVLRVEDIDPRECPRDMLRRIREYKTESKETV